MYQKYFRICQVTLGQRPVHLELFKCDSEDCYDKIPDLSMSRRIFSQNILETIVFKKTIGYNKYYHMMYGDLVMKSI